MCGRWTAKRMLLGMRPYFSNVMTHTKPVSPFSRYIPYIDYGKPGKQHIVRYFTSWRKTYLNSRHLCCLFYYSTVVTFITFLICWYI